MLVYGFLRDEVWSAPILLGSAPLASCKKYPLLWNGIA
jgi:hypothetical protein